MTTKQHEARVKVIEAISAAAQREKELSVYLKETKAEAKRTRGSLAVMVRWDVVAAALGLSKEDFQ